MTSAPASLLAPATALALPRAARIVEIVRESRSVATFVLDDAIASLPGQFVMAWLPGHDEKPLSIAWDAPLTLTVAAVGPFSNALHALKVGDTLAWRGPFGRAYRLDHTRPALLVGGGYGAAPLFYLSEHLRAAGVSVTLALGARRAEDLIFVERFRAQGVPVLLATEDGSAGTTGYITLAVEAHLAAHPAPLPAVYACGPEGLLVALLAQCRAHGLSGQLSVERYMKCGFGLCGQCALNDLLVCVDGPVLDWQALEGKPDFGRWHRTTTGRRLPL